MLGLGVGLTSGPVLANRRPVNSATAWYFAQNGLSGTPWAKLTRTGLATRTGPTGLSEWGPANEQTHSDDLTAASWARRGSVSVALALADAPAELAGSGCSVVTGLGAAPTADIYANSLNIAAGQTYSPTFWIKRTSTSGVLGVQSAKATSFGLWSINLALLPDSWQRISASHPAVTVSTPFSGSGDIFSGIQFIAVSGGPLSFRVTRVRAQRGASSFSSDDASLLTTTAARYLPRIDYNPSTLASLGLLIEGAATNLLGATEDFSNAYWSKIGLSPSPATVGDTLTVDTSNGLHIAYRSVNVTSGNAYTFSCRVRRGVGSAIATLRLDYDGNGRRFAVNPDTGAVQSAAPGFTSSVSPLDGEGFRTLKITATATTTAAVLVGFELANAGGSFWIGDGTTSLVVRNPQFETGSVATSHIPNSGTGTAVRAADDWFLSGDALTAALGADTSVGALFVEFVMPAVPSGGAFPGVISIETPTERLSLWVTPTGLVSLGGYGGAAANAQIDFGTYVPGATVKAAFRWTATGYAGTTNGLSVVTSANARNLAGATALRLGKTVISAPYLNSTIGRALVLSPSITNAQMQALTA